MIDETLEPLGVGVKSLAEMIDKQLTFSFTSGYLALLRRHGFEREDVVQSVLEQLIRDQHGYDPNKGEITTFVATLTARKLHRMARDSQNTKRKVQHHSVSVSIHADTPQELVEVFGKTPDHAGQLRTDHVRQKLLETYSTQWVEMFLEYTVGGYSVREMTLRYPEYSRNKLNRTFSQIRKTARTVFEEYRKE